MSRTVKRSYPGRNARGQGGVRGDARNFDHSCRNHGNCSYCAKGRQHAARRRTPADAGEVDEDFVSDDPCRNGTCSDCFLGERVDEAIEDLREFEDFAFTGRYDPLGCPACSGDHGPWQSCAEAALVEARKRGLV